MSTFSIPSTLPALPPVNTLPHGHGHGHKKSSELDTATDSTGSSPSSTAAQIPVGSSSGLFGTLLSSLEQVIGIQPAAASTSAASAASKAANATPAGTPGAAPAAKISVMA